MTRAGGPLSLSLPLTRESWAAFRAARRSSVQQLTFFSTGSLWLLLLFIALLGYSTLGKGWAYVGVPPVFFIGEVTLMVGMAAVFHRGRFDGFLRNPTLLAIVALAIWGAVRTIPYISQYGTDALRDAVLWGYGAFAIVCYGYLVAYPARLKLTIGCFYRYCVIFLPLVPFIWAATRFFSNHVPRWPWAPEVPVVDAKGGDVMVHLAGIMAFWVSGLGRAPGFWRVLILAGSMAAVGAYNRGGMLAVLVVFGFCMLLRPKQRSLWHILLTGVAGLMLLGASDLRVSIPGKARDLSFNQVIANLTSVFADDEKDGSLSGTKEWRLKWWGQIVDYTVGGPYFWTGKGYGINLADDDGFQGTQWEGRLRSPHNGHLTFLARSGVPGFALWLFVLGSWFLTLLHTYRVATIRGQRAWAGLFLFLMAYWLAFMVNGTFDVFLEGPMGGVWFWVVTGIGLAAVQIYRTRPDLLEDAQFAPVQ